MEKSYYNFDNLNVVNLYKWRKQGSNQNSLDLKIDYRRKRWNFTADKLKDIPRSPRVVEEQRKQKSRSETILLQSPQMEDYDENYL